MSLPTHHALLEVKTADDGTIARLTTRRIDESNVEAVGKRLSDLAAGAGQLPLQLDFDRVEYINSTGLGKLVGLHKRLQAAGGRLALCNVNPFVYEVFNVTRLTQVLDVQPKDGTGAPALTGTA